MSNFFGWCYRTFTILSIANEMNKKCDVNNRLFLMGELRRNRLGPRELLAVAVTERELHNIRLILRERNFSRKVILITKCSLVLLGMCFVTEVNALRILTLILLAILVGLSFYLIFQSLQRCEALTTRLNQEIRDFRDLMHNSKNEE